MANGISTAGLALAQKQKSVADKLASQTKDFQKQPWWKTVGSIALPLIASIAMPGVGTLLSGLSGTWGALGSAAATIGKGLQMGKQGASLLSTLGSLGAKSLYNYGTSQLSKGILEGLDPRDITDIGRGLTPAEIAVGGGEAARKIKQDYTSAEDANKEATIGSAVMMALAQQGGIDNILKRLYGKAPVPEVGAISEGAKQNMLEGLINIAKGGPSGQEKNLANMLKVQELGDEFGQNILQSQLKPSLPSQQNMLQGLITDARGRVGGRFDSIESIIASQQVHDDFYDALPLFPNIDATDYQSILDAYYNAKGGN